MGARDDKPEQALIERWRENAYNCYSSGHKTETSVVSDPAGRITGVRLTIPAGTRLPARIGAYVIVDAFPIGKLSCRAGPAP